METSDEILTKISSNWDTFRALLESTSQKEQFVKLLDHFEDRLSLAPASSKFEYHNSFPGGLVDHSLRVLKNFNVLQKAYNQKFKKENMIIAACFHDFGKCGSLTQEYYLEQDSDWHLKQGNNYKMNQDIDFMTVTHRSLFILQHFGIKLDHETFVGILVSDGQFIAENKPYALKEPMFSVMLHQADLISTLAEKGRKSVLDPDLL